MVIWKVVCLDTSSKTKGLEPSGAGSTAWLGKGGVAAL